MSHLQKTYIAIDKALVDCYGPMRPDLNVLVVGTYRKNAEPFEEFYCNDDECETWEAVGKALAPWAKRIGLVIEELSSC